MSDVGREEDEIGQVDEDMTPALSAESRLDNLLLNVGESKPGLEDTKEMPITENEGREHWQAPRNAQKFYQHQYSCFPSVCFLIFSVDTLQPVSSQMPFFTTNVLLNHATNCTLFSFSIQTTG
jgi:hypothetical protein